MAENLNNAGETAIIAFGNYEGGGLFVQKQGTPSPNRVSQSIKKVDEATFDFTISCGDSILEI